MKKKSKLEEATFSKRCQGLFKKASDFRDLTGVQIDMMTLSPAGRPYSLEKIEKKKRKIKEATFSKRCQGLFKKASKFSVLTGSGIDMVAFSPTGKPYSLGSHSSSMETVLLHYLNGEVQEQEEEWLLYENLQTGETEDLKNLQTIKTGLAKSREGVLKKLEAN